MPVDGRAHNQRVRLLDATEHGLEVIVVIALAVAVYLVLGEVQLLVGLLADELACQARRVAVPVGTPVDEEDHVRLLS